MENLSNIPILSLIIFLPLAGIFFILLIDRDKKATIRTIGMFFSILTFLISLLVFYSFSSGTSSMQFVEHLSWIPEFGIQYYLGIDGISLFMVLLTTFLMPICLLSTYKAIDSKVKEFISLMLLLETSLLGVFCAIDMVLFYVFWEATLIPMYFIIGIWGGPRKIYATIKFVLYTMTGSVLMLIGIIALYFLNKNITGISTFEITKYYGLNLTYMQQYWIFLAFFFGFAIKVPMFPFHTWLPDAHVEAPTAGSVILAGILLKMGTYGFLRFSIPIFPDAAKQFAHILFSLAIIGIIYGALMALAQDDIKKLVAYSSVSHLGFCMIGMFSFNNQGIAGSILQMINHGLSTGALFLIVGMIYERSHTRIIDKFGGVSKVMPIFWGFFMIVTLSSIGLPLTNGFVGEFLIILGVFKVSKISAALTATGVILGAIYMLWMFKRVMYGVPNEKVQKFKDLDLREIIVLVPIIIMIFWIGIYPDTFLSRMQESINMVLSYLR
jgi:NADH-quinone oxidoreductase subunit M